MGQGMSREDARRRALRAFGSVTRQKQSIRDGWGIRMLRDAAMDVRQALRQLRLSPGFTATALLTLSLGIGATTAIASLVRQVLLRRPPVVEPERLAALYTTCRRGDLRCSSSYPDFIDYRERSTRFGDMAGTSSIPLNLGTESSAHLARGEVVTGNFFGLLGLRPSLGRLIHPRDDLRGGAQQVAVVSHGFWRSALGADSGVVGRAVLLNGTAFTVVGIGPPGFQGLELRVPSDVWIPMQAAVALGASVGSAGDPGSFESRGSRWIGTLVGRLAPDATLEQARQEMAAIAVRMAEDFPQERAAVAGPRQITVDPAEHYILPVGREAELRRFLALLMGTVGFALLLACANVANLLLARATARSRELGVQLAVGAGRARLVRKLLTESVVLSVIGAGAGLLVARVMLGLLSSYELPGGVAIGGVGASLDGQILALALVLALGTAMLFGLAPAWQVTRQDLAGFMKGDASRRDGVGLVQLRRGLVAVQVALCLVLLAGSAVFAQTLRNSLRADLGFEPEGAAMLRFNPSLLGLTSEQHTAMRQSLLERVRAVPGVRSASMGTLTPFQGGGFQGFFATIGGYTPAPDEEIRFDGVLVAGDYFSTLGIRVREGRPIDGADGPDAQPVAVVNQRAAELYWAGRSPVGGTISVGGSMEARVVGVAESPTWSAIGEDPTPFVFLAMDQIPAIIARGFVTLVVRTGAQPSAVLPAVTAAFRDVLPGLSPSVVATMDDQVGTALMPQRLGSMLLTAFGGLALVLAGVGIYGVVGYNVVRQSREIGIRIAIGSSAGGILRTVVLGMAGPVLVGLAIGVGAAIALSRSVAGFMYEVSPADPVALGLVAVVLLSVALLATLIPARRAARTDPVRVLSAE